MLQDAVNSAACEGLLREWELPQIANLKLDWKGTTSLVGFGFSDKLGA